MNHYFPYTIERLDFAGDVYEIEISVEGTYRFGAPESGPTYSCAGEPADPDEFEITAIDGLPDHITLTDAEYSAIELYAYENPPEDDYYEEYD